MNKLIILNKLKLLNINNPWQVSVVQELSNRRGMSARIDTLFRDTKKRVKATKSPDARKRFNNAVANLMKYGLLFEKNAISGLRLHLVSPIWQLEDGLVESISTPTIALSLGRRNNIGWRTILKEVRRELSSHNIKLSNGITQTLVRYFLIKRCGWKLLSDGNLTTPIKMRKKTAPSPEQQDDLFS